MTNIIDLEKYRSLSGQKDAFDLRPEDREEIERIKNETSEKYLGLMSDIDKSFQFIDTEEQDITIKESTGRIIRSYEEVVVLAVGEIIANKVEAYLLSKYC